VGQKVISRPSATTLLSTEGKNNKIATFCPHLKVRVEHNSGLLGQIGGKEPVPLPLWGLAGTRLDILYWKKALITTI
jgi:hypothetical protein